MTSKITIITPAWNSETTIEDTILSVLSQDYNNIEYIIVDGGSKDGTGDIIARHVDNISVYISEPDNGIYHAMNKGIARATGDIIAILNSDDFYAHNSVISKMAGLIENEGLDAAYADLDYIKTNDTNKIVRCWKPDEYKKGAFRNGWVPPHPTFFCRTEVYRKYGSYLNHFKIAADFELMLRFIEKYGIKTGYLPEVIVKMRTGGKASVVTGIIKGNLEILRAFRINGFGIPLSYFIHKPMRKLKQLRICGCSGLSKNQD